jgi:transposase InsO family protein
MPSLRRMAKEELVRGLTDIEQVGSICEACMAGKQKRSSFPDQASRRAEKPLELVHGDLGGPVTLATPSGNSYFLLLVDDRNRFMWATLPSSKAQAATAIKNFQARAEGEVGCKLMGLRTDRGGEFTSKEFMEYCIEEGVKRQLTSPYSP